MRRYKERASALRKAHSKTKAAGFVVATNGATLPRVEVAAFSCGKCHAEFASTAGSQPFCVSCGSHNVHASADESTRELPPDSDEIHAVKCSNCGVYNGMHHVTASALSGHLHCIECGSAIEITDDAYDGLEMTAGSDDGQQEKPNVGINLSESLENEDGGFDVQLVEAASHGDDSAERDTLDLTYAGDRVIAFLNGVPVASLRKEAASDRIKQVFDSKSFIKGVKATVEETGISAALEEYGFTPYRVTVPVTPQVKKLVAEKEKELDKRVAETAADLVQCLSIASVAMNKGALKGRSNPLKAGFTHLLETCGVSGAEKAVNRVFAACADAYHKELITAAVELSQKPMEYRNALSDTLPEIKSDTDEASTSVEARLSRAAVAKDYDGTESGEDLVSDYDYARPKIKEQASYGLSVARIAKSAGGLF